MPDGTDHAGGDTGADGALRRFLMVAHGGPLEAKAAVLAASLRHQLGAAARLHVAVPVPAERWGPLSDPMRRLMDALGVEVVATENRISPDYPHGNKIAAMEGIAGPCAFLDSDMIALRPFVTHWSLLAADAAAKPADISTYARGGGDWAAAYRCLGLPMPTRRVTASETGERMAPYYNAGFVHARDAAALARCWEETAQALDADPAVPNKRPWLDQVALPIAFARLGWEVSEADPSLNFPGHIKADDGSDPFLLHYHAPANLRRFPRALALLRRLARAHPDLAATLAQHDEWDELAG